MRFTNQIVVGHEFPLVPGEVLRIRTPGTRKELRITVGGDIPQMKGSPVRVFAAQAKPHDVGTNKESISMVGNERKLRRV